MSNNFNKLTGIPPNGNAQNGYGELTNSLIFPGPMPFQQIWSPTGWQNNVQENFNSYQGNAIGSNVYFPTQQDFVAFDDGDDFYNNDDPDTPMTSDQMEDTTESNGTTNRDQPGNPQEAAQKTTGLTHLYKPVMKTETRDPSLSNGSNSTQEAPTTKSSEAQLAALRAAALRAKLMSQRRVAGKTPTPEVTPGQKAGAKEKSSLAGFISSNNDGKISAKSSRVYGQSEHPIESALVTNPPGVVPFAKSPNNPGVLSLPKVPSPQQSHTSTDIEALLAEARNTAGTNEDESLVAKITESTGNGSPNVGLNTTHRSTPSTTKASEPVLSLGRLQSFESSKASSEVSEQGEIREEPKKKSVPKSKDAPEPVPLEELQIIQKIDKTLMPEVKPHIQAQFGQKKQQPGKIDTSLASDPNSGAATSYAQPRSTPPLDTPISSKPSNIRDEPSASNLSSKDRANRYTDVRERMAEARWIAPDRRPDHNRGRPREPFPREPYVREPRSYDAFRPDYSARPYVIDENERRAAEYKRNLQQSRVEEKDVVMAELINEEPKSSPKTSSPKTSVAVDSAEYYADVNEWLDMTGYHDQAYRKKALARHQKLLALDKERAELEREAQAEREEQSQIIRAQSIMPRESIEGSGSRIKVASRIIPSFTMPPPPIPAKDGTDEVGIQIKDLATREPTSTQDRGINSTLQHHESPRPLIVAIKRQHSGDDMESPRGRSMGKVLRTNSNDFSSDMKTQQQIAGVPKPMTGSLESRISVDEGNFRREYQQRSRSPDIKHRSLSPPSRRASGQDTRMERQFSRGSFGSRNGYSPNRRPAYSRDASPSHIEAGFYDDSFDGNSRRYDAYRYNYDPRANVGYDHYGANSRGGPYHQNPPPHSRGRGRGRGRGNFNHHRGNGYKAYDDAASG